MTATDESKIINRVRKMLKLAACAASTEGERDNALRMAHATLAKHNLSMTQAELDDPHGAVEPDEVRGQLNLAMTGTWSRRLAGGVAKLFFCYTFKTKRDRKACLAFVGKLSNTVTASEMASYLIASIKRQASKERKASDYDRYWYSAFCDGAAQRIVERCNELRHQAENPPSDPALSSSTSLVLASVYKKELTANTNFIRSDLGIILQFTSSRTSDRSNAAGYGSGRSFGDRVSLNRQVSSTPNHQRQLT